MAKRSTIPKSRCDVLLIIIHTSGYSSVFSDINISQSSVGTHLRRGGIFYYCFTTKFIANFVGERILKIGKHLAKL